MFSRIINVFAIDTCSCHIDIFGEETFCLDVSRLICQRIASILSRPTVIVQYGLSVRLERIDIKIYFRIVASFL